MLNHNECWACKLIDSSAGGKAWHRMRDCALCRGRARLTLPDAAPSIAARRKPAPLRMRGDPREDSMDRRGFIFGSAAAAATLKASFAQEAAYPTHAIVVVNPFPPGGAADVVGRPLAAVMGPMVQEPGGIETNSGAARAAGAQYVANAKPDGYTLLLHLTSISGFAEVDKLFGRTPKFTRADFVPIAALVAAPCVLIVNDQQPYKSLKDLIDDAKKRPNEIIFSSSGLYGALHIPTALFTAADSAVPRRRRRPEAEAFADPGRRAGADRIPRQ